MRVRLSQAGFVLALIVLFNEPAKAGTAGDANDVRVVRSGVDAMIPVISGEPLRITASGAIAYDLAAPACVSVNPPGCRYGDAERPRPDDNSPAAALIGTFVDEHGLPVAQSFAPGDAALVAVPAGARELALSVNLGAGQAASGEFTVAALPAVVRTRPLVASFVMTARMKAQHLLRRFGFSASPEVISQVVSIGREAWLSQQLHPLSINDSLALASIEPKPTRTNSAGAFDTNAFYAFERRLIQREVYTNRQVQEKMVLFWLDHFSVGLGKVGDPAVMSEYEDVLRAGALGNFTTLTGNISRTAAMLYWLDNDDNDGSHPDTNPPNENFARELMQLYTVGPYQLNNNGTIVLSPTGIPLPSFTEKDVKSAARGLTGYWVDFTVAPYDNPNTRFHTKFAPWLHAAGPETVLGTVVQDHNDLSCANYIIDAMATYPSSATFLAKELLQSLAIEAPSPRYVAEIASVWRQNVHSPDQIALVLQAIERDPEFYGTDYHSMPKEPIELFVQMARDIPIVLKSSTTYGPGMMLDSFLGLTMQEPYYPPSVFSFYPPGNKEQLISQSLLFSRFDGMAAMVYEQYNDPQQNTGIDMSMLRSRIGSSQPGAVENYLLDALVDSNSTGLAASLKAYLGSSLVDDEHLQGAIWLIATSPEFEVN